MENVKAAMENAGSAGKAQTLPFRHDRGGSHSGGGSVAAVQQPRRGAGQ